METNDVMAERGSARRDGLPAAEQTLAKGESEREYILCQIYKPTVCVASKRTTKNTQQLACSTKGRKTGKCSESFFFPKLAK